MNPISAAPTVTARRGPRLLGLGVAAAATGLPIAWLSGYGTVHQVLHLVHAAICVLFFLRFVPFVGRHYREVVGRRGAAISVVGLLAYMVVREVFLRAALPALVIVEYLAVLLAVWKLGDPALRGPVLVVAGIVPPVATVAVAAAGGAPESVVFPLFFYGELLALLTVLLGRRGFAIGPAAAARGAGLALTFATLAASVSGLFLGFGAGQMQTGPAFVMAHAVAAWLFVVVLLAHPFAVWRARGRMDAGLFVGERDPRRAWARATARALAATALVVTAASVWVVLVDHPETEAAFDARTMAAPSRWQIAGGQARARYEVEGSARCATCHPTQTRHWEASQHRHSAGPLFRLLLAEAEDTFGVVGTRYCLGCHAPGPILAGELADGGPALTTDRREAALDAGVGCATCHVVEAATLPLGNGSHRVARDPRLVLERPGYDSAVTGILFRLASSLHSRRYAKPYLDDARLCAGCHRQELDPMLGPARAVLQDTYTSWHASRFGPRGTVRAPATDRVPAGDGPVLDGPPVATCVDCHMPRTALSEHEEPIHDHRFLGGSPALAAARGDDEQAALTEAWLAGDRPALLAAAREDFTRFWRTRENPSQLAGLSERAFEATVESLYREKLAGRELPPGGVWPEGPLLSLDLALDSGTGGAPPALLVRVTNRGVGHVFPSAPGDLAETWIEVVVEDAAGEPLVTWSSADLPAEQRLGLEPLDPAGRPIRRHRVWETERHVGRDIAPDATESWRFELPTLAAAAAHRATAALRHRFPGARISRAAGLPAPPAVALAHTEMRFVSPGPSPVPPPAPAGAAPDTAVP